jgi:hypothetical protein
MKRVWSDVPRVYGAAFPILVKGGKTLRAHGPTHVPDDVADTLASTGLATEKEPAPRAPSRPTRVTRAPATQQPLAAPSAKMGKGTDSYTRLNRRSLLKSCRDRGLSPTGNESRAELLRLLRGDE